MINNNNKLRRCPCCGVIKDIIVDEYVINTHRFVWDDTQKRFIQQPATGVAPEVTLREYCGECGEELNPPKSCPECARPFKTGPKPSCMYDHDHSQGGCEWHN